ncbi:SatD family protein [Roseibium marinum]|uniref:SatD family protein n=1 Tax=Roseibium marinum TaxID=281252 RepID=UPI0014749A54|nr:SatD family protein [Roseibium marinum]
MTATHKLSVLMGDIVGSEQMDRGKLHSVFNEEIGRANETFRPDLVSPLTITLGDEFQGLVRTSAQAFKIANMLRLDLLIRGVPCRFVIGQADIETPVNPKKAWNMLGAGLSAARDRLDDKKDEGAYRFSLLGAPDDAKAAALQALLDALGAALSDMEAGWSATQLRTIALWVRYGGNADQVAKFRNVTNRSVYYALEAAGWETYIKRRDALHAYLATCLAP